MAKKILYSIDTQIKGFMSKDKEKEGLEERKEEVVLKVKNKKMLS